MVRAVKLEEGSIGSYNNASQGAFGYMSSVTGRYLFYENSNWDSNTAGINPDDAAAIAPDKTAYLPGDGPITPASMTSYSRGLNGIFVDLTGTHGTLSLGDFGFAMSNQGAGAAGANNTPSSWSAAPAPSAFTVLSDNPAVGTDRVEFIWDDNTIDNRYLEVRVFGDDAAGGNNTNTGLSATDIFYFGAIRGDTFIDTGPTGFLTSAADEIEIQTVIAGPADIDSVFDMDRSGGHTVADRIVARANSMFALTRIDIAAPSAGPTAPEVPVPLDGGTSAVGSALAVEPAESGTDWPQPGWLNAGPVDPPTGHRSFARRMEIAVKKNVAPWHSPADDSDWRAADWVLDDELLDALSVDLLTAHRQPRH